MAIDKEVQEKFDALEKGYADLKAGHETVLEVLKKLAPTEKVEVKKEAALPPKGTFKIGADEYQITAGSFYYKRKLFISEEVLADASKNAALLKALVEAQTHKSEGFLDGLVKKVN